MIPIKTAVIGFGLSGKVFHSPFIHTSKKFSLSRIVQRSARTAADHFPSVQLSSFEEVLADKAIELIVIATPNQFHYEMACAALGAGKDVIVEKPCAVTGVEAEALVACAEQNGRHLFVFHNRRWDGDFITVRQVIHSGMLGTMISYEAHYDRYKPVLNPKGWKEVDRPSISILHDLGSHIIDQAVCLFGCPSGVTAQLDKQRQGTSIYDAFTVILNYSDFRATLKSSLLVREEGPRYMVHGSSGSFIKNGIDPQEDDLQAGLSPLSADWGEEDVDNWGVISTETNGLEIRGVVRSLPGNYMTFYDNVYDVIRDGSEMALPAQEAILTPVIIDAALASHERGRTITLTPMNGTLFSTPLRV